MEIQDLLKNIWRKKWIVIFATVTGICFTILFLQFRNDRYTSTARISTGFTVDDKISLSEESRFQNRDGETKFANLMAMLKTPISYNLLSYRLLLHDLKSMNGFHKPKDVTAKLEEDKINRIQMLIDQKIQNIKNTEDRDIHSFFTDEQIDRVIRILEFKLENQEPLHSTEPDFDLIRKFLLSYGYDFKQVQNSLTIQRVRGTDFIEIAYTSGNRYLSAFAANSFCDEFIRYYSSTKGAKTTESIFILKDVVRQKKDSLDSKLEILKRYNSSDIISDSDHANVTRYDQLVELESKKDEIENRIRELELTFSKLQDDLNSSGNTHIGNQEIIALQQKIKDLNTKYIDSGSTNKNLSDSLTYLRAQLKNAISDINRQEVYASTTSEIREKIQEANIDHEVEQNKLRQVESRISRIRYGLSSNRSAQDQASGLENEIEVAKQEYLRALNTYNEAKNQQVSLNPLKQVLVANPAVSPSSMSDIIVLLISLTSSLGFGAFIAILLIITDDRIKNSSRFNRMVDIPLLTVINELKFSGKSLPNPRKIFKHKKPNWQIEFYKSAIRHLRFQLENANSKIFLFTSLRHKVGKTSTICSLAYTLSLLKKRVLIIDTNFKSNTLTRIFGVGLKEIKVVNPRMVVPKVKPLSTVKEGADNGDGGNTEKSVSSFDLVNMTKYENVYFIGNTGVKGLSPMELLSKQDFKHFLQLMSEQFDYIFLEGPALNDFADSKELTEFAQKVITVVSANSEIEPIDEQSLNFIKHLNGKAGGAVLNGVAREDIKD